MKRSTLITMIILCAFVFAAYFVILSKESDDPINETAPYIYVDQNVVEKIRVFTFDMSLQGELSFANSGDSGWCLDQNKSIPLKDRETRALLSAYSTVVASKKIEYPSDDLSQYGLDQPTYNVSIKTSDKVKRYYFGNYHDTLNSYYFKTDSSNDIYLVPAAYVEDLKVSVLDLLDVPGLPDLKNIQRAKLTSIHGIVTKAEGSENELIKALSTIEIDYAVGCKKENFKTFSLDTPAVAKIEYLDESGDPKTLTLYLGRGKSDSITYILVPDTEIICVLKYDNIDVLLSAMDATEAK